MATTTVRIAPLTEALACMNDDGGSEKKRSDRSIDRRKTRSHNKLVLVLRRPVRQRYVLSAEGCSDQLQSIHVKFQNKVNKPEGKKEV